MRAVPRQVWPAAGAVAAVVAVVGATLALANPDDTSAVPELGAATGAPTAASTGPTAPAEDATPAEVPVEAVAELPAPDDPAVSVPDYLELPPVALDAAADFGTGVAARIVGLEAVQAEARGVGEISGPGVVVTVELTAVSAPADLGDVVVNLYGPSGAAAPVVTGDPHHRPFEGSLAVGASARAAYVLRPAEPDAPARITVAYSGAVPAATFEGPLP